MVIKVNNLIKTYGKGESRFDALKGVSFEIEKGESVAIIGKSGSGKSTLMHVMAGLDHPTSGEVLYSETNLYSLDSKQIAKFRNQKIGFVFQQFFLQPSLTCLDNVSLPLKIAGKSRSERKSNALEALKEVEMDEKALNKATDLSGGQKQRVAIARALANKPEVVFADEPTGNLDSETSEKIIDLLFKLNEEREVTLIIVTHDEDIAKKCSRIIKIKDGMLI